MPQETNPKIEEFLKRYRELTVEFNIDFATYPVYIPDGSGGFKVIIQSTPVEIPEKKGEKVEEGIISPFIPDK